jgi:hypothetical protein
MAPHFVFVNQNNATRRKNAQQGHNRKTVPANRLRTPRNHQKIRRDKHDRPHTEVLDA